MSALRKGIAASAMETFAGTGAETGARRYRFGPGFIGFSGHFPGNPIMPGVLILEAMAQTGGVFLLNSLPNPEEKLVLFMQINNAKFRKQVLPGDQLIMEVELINKKSKVVMMHGKAYVNDVVVAEADFMAGIVDREKTENE